MQVVQTGCEIAFHMCNFDSTRRIGNHIRNGKKAWHRHVASSARCIMQDSAEIRTKISEPRENNNQEKEKTDMG